MPISRRDALLVGSAGVAAAGLAGGSATAQPVRAAAHSASVAHDRDYAPGRPDRDYTPVVTPDGATLPYRIVDGVKVFHLISEEVEHSFAPGLNAKTWGYNGRTHGPTIEAVEGDRVRVYVTNRLPAPTTVHWHGVILPSGMDGVGGLNQRAIHPGETFVYEWTFRQHGTFMYHSHHDEMTQMALGMMGMIVVHPRQRSGPRPDRDYAIMLSEWVLHPGAERPDPNAMGDFNILTMNARCYPGTSPLVAQRGERVRIRFGNLSAMDHHPIHLHGYAFTITETDGGVIPVSARHPDTTVLVPTGSTRTVEFIADNPGDWAMHCHMTHHVMNQMGHGIPNLTGVNARRIDRAVGALLPTYMTMGQDGMGEMGQHIEMGHMPVPDNSLPMVGARGPRDYITMGGMFTILKVRDRLTGDGDPGWYDNPEGEARPASADELSRDGIDTTASNAPASANPHQGHQP
ncbi:copper oxidase [Maricaulis sp. W15]|uniref:multicopper oxidase family protein n=1 Tax=Maricaulis sp. W15 TaxID=1772333 RepID=UPI000949134F|nr:copper oxidase [Maricaulis sp. W15]OLF78303.1 copper oxidase [Maricaulis sp. W15]